MSSDKLVYMANQIGKFFAGQRDRDPVAAIAEHIRLFWEPRMRQQIFAHLEKTHGAGLDPLVRDAIAKLRAQHPQAKPQHPL